MTKKTVKSLIAVLMLLTVCLYFISGTYARYASELTGNASVSVAKWAVAFTDGTNALQNNFALTFTVDENPNVVPNKIAPATSATAKVVVDLTGTEVAVDYNAVVTQDALATVFGASADKVKVTAKVNGNADTTQGTIALVNNQAFTADNGKVELIITLTWENDEAFNVSDTLVGENGGTLTLPVTVTLQQHIDAN